MSDKYNLFTGDDACNVAKRARCSAEIARRYRCTEGDPERRQNAADATTSADSGDRRAQAMHAVRHLFGNRSEGHARALVCEPYLRDALYQWILATCRTSPTRIAYASRLWRWVASTGRRSLSAQCETSPRSVLDHLYRLESAGMSPRSVAGHRDTLRSWFAWLAERGLVLRSPVSREAVRAFRVDPATIVRGSGSRQALTLVEAQRVAAWCLGDATPAAGLAVALQMTGGLRSAEVCALERRHAVERDGVWTLTIPGKGQKSRRIALEPLAVAALQRYTSKCRRRGFRGHLLVAPGGGPYAPRQVQRWAQEAGRIAGREHIASHDLRRTAATLLRLAGADLSQVQRHLGHSSIVLTARCYVLDEKPMTATTGIVP